MRRIIVCMMDWRIGRLIRWSPIGLQTAAITVPSNRQRVALQVSPGETALDPGTDVVAVVDTVSGVAFYVRDISTAVKLFTLAEYGSIIQNKITVETLGGNVTLAVWEATMPEDYLAAGLEQFESEYARGKRQTY